MIYIGKITRSFDTYQGVAKSVDLEIVDAMYHLKE